MTQLDIDSAFSALLDDVVGLSGVPIYLGTWPENLPHTPILIIATGQLTTVAGPFATAEVQIVLETPALPGGMSTHASRSAALRDALAASTLRAAFSSTACTLAGPPHLSRCEQRTQDARWIFECVLTCGFLDS